MISTFIYRYDDEEQDKVFEVEINYDTEEPMYSPRTWNCPEHYVPGQIYVTSVRVLLVEYYDKDGNVVATIKRPRVPGPGWNIVDSEEEARVEELVDNRDVLCDYLWENRVV